MLEFYVNVKFTKMNDLVKTKESKVVEQDDDDRGKCIFLLQRSDGSRAQFVPYSFF